LGEVAELMMPTSPNIAVLTASLACGALCGCTRESDVAKNNGSILANVSNSQSIEELKARTAKESLGGRIAIQTFDRLVVAQTFPYSGVFASHVYAFETNNDRLRFMSYFLVPTQADVEFRGHGESVEIWVDGARFAAVDQPRTNK
jgi:hypothetical protein